MIASGSKFKASEKIPVAGRYKCVVCGLVIDIKSSSIKDDSTFFACPVCHAGEDGGPKGTQDRVWEYMG